MTSPKQFGEKFIGFVDVLGFKNLVNAAENGSGLTLDELLAILESFGSADQRLIYEKHGPIVCPNSRYTHKDLDFQLTQISDSLIVSSEVSPAGVINLIAVCSDATMMLLQKGIMCRGFITRGNIYHTDKQIIGSGYQNAYSNEAKVSVFKRTADEIGTPFVAIDHQVSLYVKQCEDRCVREMYSRFVKEEGDIAALFPFKFVSHSFLVSAAQPFQAGKELRANESVRVILERLKESVMSYVDKANISAVRKAEHYLSALDDQLKVCDQIEDEIKGLSTTIEGRRVIDVFPLG